MKKNLMTRETEFKEECWILYGLRFDLHPFWTKPLFIGFQRYHTSGTAAGVEMDYSTASSPWVIGWYHTHPGTRNVTPSEIDNSTMRSWVKATYRSYLCGIRCSARSACYCYYENGIDVEKVTIVKKSKVKIKFLGPFFIGIMEGR
jgi:proteasome lid subunit RPN8/RPN11